MTGLTRGSCRCFLCSLSSRPRGWLGKFKDCGVRYTCTSNARSTLGTKKKVNEFLIKKYGCGLHTSTFKVPTLASLATAALVVFILSKSGRHVEAERKKHFRNQQKSTSFSSKSMDVVYIRRPSKYLPLRLLLLLHSWYLDKLSQQLKVYFEQELGKIKEDFHEIWGLGLTGGSRTPGSTGAFRRVGSSIGK